MRQALSPLGATPDGLSGCFATEAELQLGQNVDNAWRGYGIPQLLFVRGTVQAGAQPGYPFVPPAAVLDALPMIVAVHRFWAFCVGAATDASDRA